jgi:hypothetical protein
MSNRFRIARRLSYAAIMTALGLLCSPWGIQAASPERFVGWGTDGKVTARFSAGTVQWDAKARRVSIGFAPAPLANSDRDIFLKSGWWTDSMKQRVMSLHLNFNAGEAAASLRGLHGYAVAFYNYPGNPHETSMWLNYSADGPPDHLADAFRGWGWQELSGDLRPGGRIRGHLAFENVYENKKDHIGPIPYRWDLVFDAVMR